jgi:hypothetical protein
MSCVFDADIIESNLDVIKAKIAENKRLAAERRAGIRN